MGWSRREVLGTVVGSFGAAAATGLQSAAPKGNSESKSQPKRRQRSANEPFGYCLNTSTIRGNQLGIVQEVEAISKAGFQGIEPWIAELDAYTRGGGSLKDLGKRISDAGLTVVDTIAFNARRAWRNSRQTWTRWRRSAARRSPCRRATTAPRPPP